MNVVELLAQLNAQLEKLPQDKLSIVQQIKEALTLEDDGDFTNLSAAIENLKESLESDTNLDSSDLVAVLNEIKEKAIQLKPDGVRQFANSLKEGINQNVDALSALNDIITLIEAHPIVMFIIALVGALLLLKKAATIVNNVFGLLLDTLKFFGTVIAKVYVGAFQVVNNMYIAMNSLGDKLRKIINENVTKPLLETRDNFDSLSKTGVAFSSIMNRALGTLVSFNNPASRLSKLFGFGEGGLSAAISFVSQNLEAMGENASLFSQDILKSNRGIELFATAVKGMTLTGEDIKYWSIISRNNLKQINTTLGELAFNMKLVAKETGVDMKIMSKGFNELRRDIIHFGHISDEALLRTVARANQLGVQIKDMTSIFGKTDTIESTTQMVSQLSQAFGMNVDALKLLKSENPLEQIEMLRDSFLATGNSFNDLHFREKELLASITGLSGETMAAIMDYKNASKSIEEIKKSIEDDKPEQKQINAINQMTSSVKELIHVMTDFKDPLEAFTSGFVKKLQLSVPEVMKLSKSLENVYQQGLNTSASSIRNLIEPFKPIINKFNEITKHSGRMFSDILKNASSFFKNITSDWSKNGNDMLKSSSAMIENIFSITSNGASKVLNTFHEIFLNVTGWIVKAAMSIVPGILQALNNAINAVRQAFKNPSGGSKFLDAMGLSVENFKAFFAKISEIWNGDDKSIGLKDNIKSIIDPVVDYLKEKLTKLASFIGKVFANNLKEGFVIGMPSVARQLMGDEAFLQASRDLSKAIMSDVDNLKRSSTFLDADYMQNMSAAYQQFIEKNAKVSLFTDKAKEQLKLTYEAAIKEVNISETDYKQFMGMFIGLQKEINVGKNKALEGYIKNSSLQPAKLMHIELFDNFLKKFDDEAKARASQQEKLRIETLNAAKAAQESSDKKQAEAQQKAAKATADAVKSGAAQGVAEGIGSAKIETTMNLDNQAINILHRVITRANLNPYAIVSVPQVTPPGQNTPQIY